MNFFSEGGATGTGGGDTNTGNSWGFFKQAKAIVAQMDGFVSQPSTTNDEDERESNVLIDPITGYIEESPRDQHTISPPTLQSAPYTSSELGAPSDNKQTQARVHSSDDLQRRLNATMQRFRATPSSTSSPSPSSPSPLTIKETKNVETIEDVSGETKGISTDSKKSNPAVDEQERETEKMTEGNDTIPNSTNDSIPDKHVDTEERTDNDTIRITNARANQDSSDSPASPHQNGTQSAGPLSHSIPDAATNHNSGTGPDVKAMHSIPKSPANAEESAEILRRIIEQREKQLMNAMEQNAELNSELEQERSKVREIENRRNKEVETMMAQVMSLETQIKEWDSMRSKGLSGSAAGLQKMIEEQKQQLAEKEEKISGLLQEGEKLSKNELKNLNTIKKLRAERTEQEKQMNDLQKRFEKLTSDHADLQSKLTRATEAEKRANDRAKQLSDTSDRHLKQINRLEAELASLKETNVNLQVALDRARLDLTEARKAGEDASSQAQSSALEKELKANEELHRTLEAERNKANEMEQNLRRELLQLRAAISNAQEQIRRQEEDARHEIESLYSRLHVAETRGDDLAVSVQEATRPLLRQIESLQSQHSHALKNWNTVEKNLTARLQEAELEREKAEKSARSSLERLEELSGMVSSLEGQLTAERRERAKQRSEFEAVTMRVKELETRAETAESNLAETRTKSVQELEKMRREHEQDLKHAVERERLLMEEKYRREAASASSPSAANLNAAAGPVVVDQEHAASYSPETRRKLTNRPLITTVEVVGSPRLPTSPPARSLSAGAVRPEESLAEGTEAYSARSSLDSTTYPASTTSGGLLTSGAPSTVIVERLQSNIRYLEGQIGSLQVQLQSSNQTRDELMEELLKLESVRDAAARLPQVEKEMEELNFRYQTTLELLGEKTEKAIELQADLDDVKEAYREQIQQLLARIEVLERDKSG
ncbi:uncharacterized protein VTP21DRAFT_10628 [Calcarisporiella thermophila]|uniref:uncharacterized protein n=1 Tax=Calcarisporiella thermophila TaxID=911321 RepID=UPI0037441A6B